MTTLTVVWFVSTSTHFSHSRAQDGKASGSHRRLCSVCKFDCSNAPIHLTKTPTLLPLFRWKCVARSALRLHALGAGRSLNAGAFGHRRRAAFLDDHACRRGALLH